MNSGFSTDLYIIPVSFYDPCHNPCHELLRNRMHFSTVFKKVTVFDIA